jgi:hypothetical protein
LVIQNKRNKGEEEKYEDTPNSNPVHSLARQLSLPIPLHYCMREKHKKQKKGKMETKIKGNEKREAEQSNIKDL